jgi:REP element-mobilizing transposase RayT
MAWLGMLASTCARFNFTIHSFCQMTNHYHLVLEAGEANLSQGMRHLNGMYSQYFNRRHQLVGHLFQGRYKAILVQKDVYLRELARYVVLNPVRAGIVSEIEEWRWSSYHYMVQHQQQPVWLQTDWILSLFGTRRTEAIAAYRQFVIAGIGEASPIERVRHQLLLGDDVFIAHHRSCQADISLSEVTKEHRRAVALSLGEYEAKFAERDTAIFEAYHSTAYTMAQIAIHFRISYRTVSRVVHRMDALRPGSCTIGRTDPE